jgi:hypothetical protein
MIPIHRATHPHTGPGNRIRTTLGLALALAGLAVAGFCLAPAEATAQGNNQDQVRDYLERTKEIISMVTELVEESESRRARLILKRAQDLHELAETQFPTRPMQARKTSEEARKAARHAARIARDALGSEEQANHRLDHLQERLDQVYERARDSRNERALRFLREADRQLRRAREQFHQRNFGMSLNLLDSVETLLNRAARLLFEGRDAGRLQIELDRTWEFYEKTLDQLGPEADPKVKEILDRARQRLVQARESLGRGEPIRTVGLLRQARRLTARVASLGGGGPDEDTVQGQIERFDSRATAVAEAVQESGEERAVDTLARARRYRGRAEEMLAEGDREEALRQIKIAHDLLREAGEQAR